VLAVGKRLVRRQRDILPDSQGQLFGQRGTYVSPPGQDLADGFRQLLGSAFLRHVASRARLQGTNRKLVFRVSTQDQNREPVPFGLYFLEEIQAAFPRQGDVEQRDIPLFYPKLFQRLPGVGGFSKCGPVELIGKQFPQTTPDNSVVIDDEDSYHGMAPGMAPDSSGDGSGIQAVTVVPFPGALEIFTPPPRTAARSRIPSRPRDLDREGS